MNIEHVLSPLAKYYADNERAIACDALFDGGEWSGPAHERSFAKLNRLAIKKARARAGMSRSAFNTLLANEHVKRTLDDMADEFLAQ